jgi:hypothetical protein
MTRARKTTKKHMDAFLEALIETGGNVKAACTLVGLPRRTIYDLKRTDEEFAARYAKAHEMAVDSLIDEARRRGHTGVEEPVFYQGGVAGYITKYSDPLLMFIIKAHRPEYRDSHKVEFGASAELTNLANRLSSALERKTARGNASAKIKARRTRTAADLRDKPVR